MTAKVVLNPYSNRWNSQVHWSEAESALMATGLGFGLVKSKKKRHIIELVMDASREGFSHHQCGWRWFYWRRSQWTGNGSLV